jgi:hypothetical protein
MAFTHKIPQNVTKYESRIIGRFTPRQFIYLAIGGLIIMLFFMLPFPPIIGVIVAVFVIPVTLLLAIVSFDGRRTDIWIFNFLQAISVPTQRVWQKDEVPPQVLLPSYVVPHHELKKKQKTGTDLEEFLGFWRTKEVQKDYSEEEKEFLNKIAMMSRYTQSTDTSSATNNETVPEESGNPTI